MVKEDGVLGRVVLALGLAALGLALPGCAGDLPLEDRIANVRPLAIRTEVIDPAPIEGEAVRAEALPLETVRVIPFVTDPQGPWSPERIAALLDPVWVACTMQPVQGVFGCITAARPLDPDDLPDCPPVDPGAFDPMSPMIPSVPSPCVVVTDEPGAPTLTVPLDPAFLLGGDLEVTMIGHRPGEGSTADCLGAVLDDDADPGNECIVTSQRVSVGPDGRLIELAGGLGLPVGALPPPPDPIPDADRHPRILELRVAVFEDPQATAPDQVLSIAQAGMRLSLPAGARVEIEVEASEDDLQTYAIPGDMGSYSPRDEDYDGRWFRTWGGLLGSGSDDPIARNTWTLVPGDQDPVDEATGPVPPDGIATLLYVLRDGRVGVTWTWLQVEVLAAPM